MKYFSLSSIINSYNSISVSTKDKFWGILGILYSIEKTISPSYNYTLDTVKLSTFLEETFRLKNKKNYDETSSVYSVVFSDKWEEAIINNFIIGKPNIMPIVVWAYRRKSFDDNLSLANIFEMFLNDFHLSKTVVEKIFNIDFMSYSVEFDNYQYDEDNLLVSLGGSITSEATTIKLNRSFVVANAGDLSRGPFFQPLYAALNTLECLTLFPFVLSEYYTLFGKKKEILSKEKKCNQQIFYGAPGTGKSHKIKDDESVKAADEKNLVFRTTFHPDSDYSTFVGAYKPSMKSLERIYTPEELTVKLKEIKTTGTTYPCHKFAAKYWESIKDLSPDSIKQILNACGFTDNYSVEVGKGVAIGQEYLDNPEDGKIIYTFCPQAFASAYVEAWKTEDDVYLVIEEINRGNCAQIFGDLFQLLDRKNGVSEYPVEADTDLQNYLQNALADTTRTDIPEEVKSGKKLMLPSNLYIWATMNTSDQSLFPIDSAFKRRWEWKYIKIKEGKDENGNKLDWKVDVKMDDSGTLLFWWDFIKKINEIIASMTSSADKQLGYFFCCAKDGVIDEETFVSKVIFYLWNDVFKDYGFEDASLFRYTTKDEDGKDVEKDLTFPDFYDEEGEKVNTERLTDFVKKVMSWKKTNAEQD